MTTRASILYIASLKTSILWRVSCTLVQWKPTCEWYGQHDAHNELQVSDEAVNSPQLGGLAARETMHGCTGTYSTHAHPNPSKIREQINVRKQIGL
jgi:hypothetical protein